MRGHLGSNRFSWVATPRSTHRPDGLVPGHLDGTFLWHYLTCVCGGNDIAGKVPDGTTTFTHLGVHRLGNSNRSPGRVVYLHPLGEVQTMVPSGSFLGYRLVKPGSPLVMAAYAPGETQVYLLTYGSLAVEKRRAMRATRSRTITSLLAAFGAGFAVSAMIGAPAAVAQPDIACEAGQVVIDGQCNVPNNVPAPSDGSGGSVMGGGGPVTGGGGPGMGGGGPGMGGGGYGR